MLKIPQLHQHLPGKIDISVSQGSVATRLRCGGILSAYFIENLQLCVPSK